MEVLLEIKKLRNKSITMNILNEIIKVVKNNKLSILQSEDTMKIVKE